MENTRELAFFAAGLECASTENKELCAKNVEDPAFASTENKELLAKNVAGRKYVRIRNKNPCAKNAADPAFASTEN